MRGCRSTAAIASLRLHYADGDGPAVGPVTSVAPNRAGVASEVAIFAPESSLAVATIELDETKTSWAMSAWMEAAGISNVKNPCSRTGVATGLSLPGRSRSTTVASAEPTLPTTKLPSWPSSRDITILVSDLAPSLETHPRPTGPLRSPGPKYKQNPPSSEGAA